MPKYRLNPLVLLSLFSASALAEPVKGLVDGQLAPCPDKPNCISTEKGSLSPIAFGNTNPKKAWEMLQESIIELNGKIESKQDNYLWASFTTPMLKFTDDVEARLDLTNKVIQLRSASRTGYYDFNANKNRLNLLINRVNRKLNPGSLKNIPE